MKYTRIVSRIAGMVAVAAVSLLSVGCDNIAEDDRYIDFPLPPVPPPSEVSKNLLIWEYTGQRCTNCPDGAKQITDLMEAYPEQVFAVGIHPAGVTFTNPFPIGAKLTCDAATEFYRSYPQLEFPYAIFDGQRTASSDLLERWPTQAIEILAQGTRPPVMMTVEAKAKNGVITVETDMECVTDFGQPMNISVWVIENGLVAPQESRNGRLMQYVHNHVLRGSLGGLWGSAVQTPMVVGENRTSSVSGNADPSWNLANCEVIVFVADPSSHYVYQCQQAHIEVE